MNLTKLNSNTNDFETLAKKIGTPEDSEALRARYHRLLSDIKNLIQQTNSSLTQLKDIGVSNEADQKRKKTLTETLSKQYMDILNRFQEAQRFGARKEKESLDRARSASIDQNNPNDSQFSSQMPGVSYHQQQVVLKMEQDVDMNALRERDEQLRQLETNIVEVNELFKDVAKLVYEQGGIIDSIEQHVVETDNNVVTGNQKLVQARVYQTSARRKKIILIVILIVVLIVIGLILFFVLKK